MNPAQPYCDISATSTQGLIARYFIVDVESVSVCADKIVRDTTFAS